VAPHRVGPRADVGIYTCFAYDCPTHIAWSEVFCTRHKKMLTPELLRWLRDENNQFDMAVMIEARHYIAALEAKARAAEQAPKDSHTPET
jgi:hypothetical protein